MKKIVMFLLACSMQCIAMNSQNNDRKQIALKDLILLVAVAEKCTTQCKTSHHTYAKKMTRNHPRPALHCLGAFCCLPFSCFEEEQQQKERLASVCCIDVQDIKD